MSCTMPSAGQASPLPSSYHRFDADRSIFRGRGGSTFVATRAAAASHEEPTLLLELQMGGLDDVGKDLDVAIDRLAELFAGTAAGVDRHRLELVAHPRISQCAPGLRAKLVGDRRRRAGRDE